MDTDSRHLTEKYLGEIERAGGPDFSRGQAAKDKRGGNHSIFNRKT
jgi:hypothetical protein